MFKDNFQTIARAHHLALATERSYWGAARNYIKWLGAKSADDLCKEPTENFRKFLSEMANDGERIEGDEGVSASTQNLHFHAVRFLLEKVMGCELGDLSKIPRATGHVRIVDVPDDDTAKRLVENIPGQNGTALRTIYGTAGRLNDILRLGAIGFRIVGSLIGQITQAITFPALTLAMVMPSHSPRIAR